MGKLGNSPVLFSKPLKFGEGVLACPPFIQGDPIELSEAVGGFLGRITLLLGKHSSNQVLQHPETYL